MKLTNEHLKIYKRYRGDVDMWARSRKKSERIMTNELWEEIDGLLSRLEMRQKKLASDSFNAEPNDRLSQLCSSPEIEQELVKMVGK